MCAKVMLIDEIGENTNVSRKNYYISHDLMFCRANTTTLCYESLRFILIRRVNERNSSNFHRHYFLLLSLSIEFFKAHVTDEIR